MRKIVEEYAGLVRHRYGEAVASAERLKSAVDAFVATPSEETLRHARSAWTAARIVYGRTEVFRFYDGPIDHAVDGVETLVNAWPVDEAYLDGVAGAPDGGIIQSPERYPHLTRTVLELANERGGEANISLGWHAVEFLLWGQDRSADGPGSRPAEDFVPGRKPYAARRAEYLRVATEALVEHLRRPYAAWGEADGEGAYRRKFTAAPDALKRILTGAVVLSGFEMAGERLAVAYETGDQEQEHSCFSDTTHLDFIAGQAGIVDVLLGTPVAAGKPRRASVIDLLERRRPEVAAALRLRVDAATRAVAELPVPFDRALAAPRESPERRLLLKAIEALEAQTEAISLAGLALELRLPLRPGG
jgi:putative iron-regulated protein